MRRSETRARLLDATVECLIELGYAGTTTPIVCERAGLSRGALLHHYPTKTELVIEAVGHLALKRAAGLESERATIQQSADPMGAMLDLIWASFSGPLFYAALELWVAARTDHELLEPLQRFERNVARAMGQMWRKLSAPEAQHADFDDLVLLTLYVMRGMALQKILRDDDSRRRRLFERWKTMVTAALRRDTT
jgi:AcrR family transcriptional regulator